jgi:16S rRNA (guanine966-N2)-methyltransferase
VQIITRNCDKLAFTDAAHILTTDACQITSWHFDIADIIFCDAPYDSGLSLPALDALNKAGGIGADTIIAVETRRKEPELSGCDFTLLDSRHYGIARLSFYKLS